MVLTENEAWLLARGYSFDKENIRIPIRKFKILNNYKLEDVYLIDDMEAAKELYKRYKKSYRRKFKIWNDDFIDNTLIVKMVNEDKQNKI
ncbi:MULTISPECIES: hypothetical protein [Clostridium]|uniref:hypothetical protein n=1 Tax=Clostridium TaxID=1485 RepID=UPI000823FD9E|nr:MULTISPECIES: hypothetical protein [Clostridium]PJI08310.1 hypothetical protein CUB90_10735 [Clostridium sp. CT7]